MKQKKQRKRIERADVTRHEKVQVKKGIYFVTAIELGSPAYKPFLAAIETFLKAEKAELALLPMKSHRSASEDLPFDTKVVEKYGHKIYTELELNKNIAIIELELNSQQINPLTGTARLSREMRSVIIGHSKQHLRTFPTGNTTLPRIQCTTGALTIPNYKHNRIGRIATADHIVGGLILGISKDRFHVYQVQCLKDGSFCYLNKRYHADGRVTTERAEGLILGDWHSGFTDPEAEEAAFEMAELLKPKHIVFHDFFDSANANHHIENNIDAQLNMPKHLDTLEKEIAFARADLKKWFDRKPRLSQLVMVPSNHPEHLHRYLNEGRYVKDLKNYKKAVELAFQYHVNGLDPVQYSLDPQSKYALWLPRKNDFRISGVHVGNHGDKGIGGSRGSMNNNEFAYENCVTGHTHTAQITHRAMSVATNSLLFMGYNLGPNTWVHANAVVYEGGQKSLLIVVKGKWKI